MVASSEGHEGPGKEAVSRPASRSESEASGTTNVASKELSVERFSESDPQRSRRIAEVDGEAGAFLSDLGYRMQRPEDLDATEWRRLQRDVAERQGWNEATSNVFKGILRLGVSTPPRSKRVL